MFTVLLCLCIVTFVAYALSKCLNRRIEECVPVVLTGTVFSLYLFYLFDLLFVGRVAVYVLFAGVLIAGLRKAGTERQHKTEQCTRRRLTASLFTPGMVLFFALALLFLIYASGLKPAVWDELRLWAAMPKALHVTESLQVGEGALLVSTMQSYPPGMALLAYFFTTFSDGFSYGSTFAVYWIFMAALLLPAFAKLSWKHRFVLPIAFFAVLIVPILLTVNGAGASGDWNFFYVTLYIDPLLGCVMGYAMAQAIRQPFADWFSALSFAFSLFMLPAMKNAGAIYAAVAFAAALALWLLEYYGKKRAKDEGARLHQGWESSFLRMLLPLFLLAFSYISWQILIRTRGSGEFIDFDTSSFTADKLQNVLNGMTAWGTIPFLYYALFFVVLGLVLTFVYKESRRRTAFIGAGGFLLSFFIFFYGYTSHYGLMLSSVHRYTSTFTFAAFVYLFYRVLGAVRMQAGEKPLAKEALPKVKTHRLHKIKTVCKIMCSAILAAGAVVCLFFYSEKQYKNPAWDDAQRITEEVSLHLFASSYEPASIVHPKKTYLALGGDTRKQSQRHETFALEAIGSPINMQNIWCDKLVNEAEHGVVTDAAQQAAIWAETLLSENYHYVLICDADEEILQAVQQIAPDIAGLHINGNYLLHIEPAQNPYGITFAKSPVRL